MNTLSAEAEQIFRSAIDNLIKDAGGDYGKCLEWPRTWPAHWGEKPKGYSTSRNKDGYAQFQVPKGSGPKHYYAHRLVLQIYEKDNANTAKAIIEGFDGHGNEMQYFGRQLRDGDHTRHDEGCKKHCVNVYHLRRGTPHYNSLDNLLPKIRDEALRREVMDCCDELLQQYKGPGGYRLWADLFKIEPWEVMAILYRFGGYHLHNLRDDNGS